MTATDADDKALPIPSSMLGVIRAVAEMSGLSILPDQVYGEESFESPSRRRRGLGGGDGGTKIPVASGQSYEDDDLDTSPSLSGCSSGYDIHEEDDNDDEMVPHHGGDCGDGDRYGREMRSLLKSLEDALDESDFIAGGRTTSDKDRRRRKRGDRDRGFMSTRDDWLIRPEFFCQYPRLLAAASKGSHAAASNLLRPTLPPPPPHRSTSADRALVLPMHRAAGGGAGRASKWRIRHRSAGGGDVAADSGVQRPAAVRRHKRTTSRDGGRRERRGHIKSGKALCVFDGALRFEMTCPD